MLTVPTVAQLAAFSGRPQDSYTSYANSALLQAALFMTIKAEIDIADFAGFDANDQLLCNNGIMAMADYIYLRQPYQALLASPLMNETVGSYSYAKVQSEVARNAAALEVTAEKTGVEWFDLAHQMLAKRQRAGGVFSGGITVFESGSLIDGAMLLERDSDGRLCIVGPGERDRFGPVPFDINAPAFPQDPGI